jgi:hypothetical protein
MPNNCNGCSLFIRSARLRAPSVRLREAQATRSCAVRYAIDTDCCVEIKASFARRLALFSCSLIEAWGRLGIPSSGPTDVPLGLLIGMTSAGGRGLGAEYSFSAFCAICFTPYSAAGSSPSQSSCHLAYRLTFTILLSAPKTCELLTVQAKISPKRIIDRRMARTQQSRTKMGAK